jgi:hypothetical protein
VRPADGAFSDCSGLHAREPESNLFSLMFNDSLRQVEDIAQSGTGSEGQERSQVYVLRGSDLSPEQE